MPSREPAGRRRCTKRAEAGDTQIAVGGMLNRLSGDGVNRRGLDGGVVQRGLFPQAAIAE